MINFFLIKKIPMKNKKVDMTRYLFVILKAEAPKGIRHKSCDCIDINTGEYIFSSLFSLGCSGNNPSGVVS